MPSLHPAISSQVVERGKLIISSSVMLADSQFHKPAPIDAILGIPLFHKLFYFEQISILNDSIVALKTKLDWVVSGEMRRIFPKQWFTCNKAVSSVIIYSKVI